MTPDSSFTQAGDVFIGTDFARGPWSADHCHGGPPTGVIARACEHAVPHQRLTRLTVELSRPVPLAGFTVETNVLRSGRKTSLVAATLTGIDGRVCVTATALHLLASDHAALPTTEGDTPRRSDATKGPPPVRSLAHGLPGFFDGTQLLFDPGSAPGPGPCTLWMRTVPLLPTEPMSPFQRVCPLADSGNGISSNGDFTDFSPINPDLTVSLHRDPVGEWIGSQATSRWEPNGIGLAEALLFDEIGPIGRATQTLLVSSNRS